MWTQAALKVKKNNACFSLALLYEVTQKGNTEEIKWTRRGVYILWLSERRMHLRWKHIWGNAGFCLALLFDVTQKRNNENIKLKQYGEKRTTTNANACFLLVPTFCPHCLPDSVTPERKQYWKNVVSPYVFLTLRCDDDTYHPLQLKVQAAQNHIMNSCWANMSRF